MRLPRPVILVPTLFALSAFAVAHPAAAQAPSIFVIAASEGYGIGDCLAEGGSCGQIVADAWCVAHGATHAVSFGPADDFTGCGRAAGRADLARVAGHFLRRVRQREPATSASGPVGPYVRGRNSARTVGAPPSSRHDTRRDDKLSIFGEPAASCGEALMRHFSFDRPSSHLSLVTGLVLLASAAHAQSSDCRSIQAELASLGPGDPARTAQFAKAVQKQQYELDRTVAYSHSIGCDHRQFLFFGESAAAAMRRDRRPHQQDAGQSHPVAG